MARQGGLAVAGLVDVVPAGAQVGDDDLADGRVVVDHEHVGHGALLHVGGSPRSVATTMATGRPASATQPAVYGRSRSVGLSGRAPNRPSTGTAISVTVPSTTSAAAAAPGPAGGAGSSEEAGRGHQGRQHEVVQHHPPSEPRQGGEQVSASRGSAAAGAVRRDREARGARTEGVTRRHGLSCLHLEPADPLGLQHSRPVRCDDPAG